MKLSPWLVAVALTGLTGCNVPPVGGDPAPGEDPEAEVEVEEGAATKVAFPDCFVVRDGGFEIAHPARFLVPSKIEKVTAGCKSVGDKKTGKATIATVKYTATHRGKKDAVTLTFKSGAGVIELEHRRNGKLVARQVDDGVAWQEAVYYVAPGAELGASYLMGELPQAAVTATMPAVGACIEKSFDRAPSSCAPGLSSISLLAADILEGAERACSQFAPQVTPDILPGEACISGSLGSRIQFDCQVEYGYRGDACYCVEGGEYREDITCP